MRKNITLGIIGCGYWGPNFVRNFSKLKGALVKYVCDANPEKLKHMQELYPGITALRDYRKLLDDSRLQAVVIATPAHTHYQLAREALLRKKHVLVEKPIAVKEADAKRLIGLARENSRVFMVGHTFKFNPAVIKLRQLIKNGELGRICYIYSRRTNLGPLRKDVNALWDLAPHDISIISYILGEEPVDVTARGRKFLEHNLEDVVFMTLSYPGNVFVHVHVSWLDPRKVREIIVVGNKKMAVFDDLDSKEPIKVYDKSVVRKSFKLSYDSFREFQMVIKSGETSAPKVNMAEPLSLECRHFIDCINNNKAPLTDGRDGLSVLRTILALQKSVDRDGMLIKLGKAEDGA